MLPQIPPAKQVVRALAEILRAIKGVWQIISNRNNTTILLAAAFMCFWILKFGNVVVPLESEYDPVVHLSLEDLHLDNTINLLFLEVTIKTKKTNLFYQGVKVYLGRAIQILVVVLSYIVHSGTDTGPFFRYTRNRAFTRKMFVKDVWSAQQATAIDQK